MKYLVEVFWIAVVPDLPECSSLSTTPEAAVDEIGDATLAWIAAAAPAATLSPSPRPRPATRPDLIDWFRSQDRPYRAWSSLPYTMVPMRG